MTNRILEKLQVMREVVNRITPDNCGDMQAFLISFLDDIDTIATTETKVVNAVVTNPVFVVNKPKQTSKKDYVLLQHLTSTERLENLAAFMTANYAIAIDQQAIRISYPVDKAYHEFMAERCGSKFNGNDHLWNAFKKFWALKKPEPEQRSQGDISKAHSDYFNTR